MSPAVAWMIAGIVLLIAEMFHGGLFLMWIGAGALITALCSLVVGAEWAQWTIFAVSSVILLLASRKLARSIHGRVTVPSNVDSLIGLQAIVLETIDPVANTGRIRIRSEEWRARSPVTIEQGAHVVVEKVEGATMLVRETPVETTAPIS